MSSWKTNPEDAGDDRWPSPNGPGDEYEVKTIHGKFTGGGDVACRICGQLDHFARNCPNADSGPGSYGGHGSYGSHDSYGRHDTYCGHDTYGGLGAEGTCYNCGEEGHNKADCPQPRKLVGACFNCGEEGHNKSDCPHPRVFKGTCRMCGQEGHPAASCPEKPVDICRNCGGEGHLSKDCKENRKFNLNNVPDKLPGEAWAMMKAASDARDMTDFRDAFQVYSKACPDETFATIAQKMQAENFNIYIIGLEKPSEDVISLIDLQGQLGREYVVGFYYSPKAHRFNLRDRWPATPEENLERLQNAGFPYDRGVPKCRNCGEMGHTARGCKSERIPTADRAEIKCSNCDEVGHRMRDCTMPRKNKFACRNCGSEDHQARDCTEPRSAADVECRRCGEQGHFAKDCPNESQREPRTCRNCGSTDHLARDCDQPRVMKCRNCDECKLGHSARECPEPKDWSRVKCNRCGEMGHTVTRCPQPEDYQVPGSPVSVGSNPDTRGYEGGSSWNDAKVDEMSGRLEDARLDDDHPGVEW
ncbi:Zinc knuckle CX2CX4HX4C [Penicillium argentinense]|uniref:Zinc knuckle CX2CX4HX4C n=1 Tax=Penicillium argentinense TaxID=1131581 RepID=A0A9W9JV67_9EURO|nr:Zinc knuckle CX2CX4HX4C [Penicillium argentinense]KAJ5082753.1 Zinc knuckle CX2CX4HX4C [Penicillium argentinense]